MSEYAASLQRLLVDSKTEARQKACADITAKTAATFADVPPEEAYRLTMKSLQSFQQQYIKNVIPAFRRAGMASVKATVAGLPSNKKHNPELIKFTTDLVLPMIADTDPSVRIAALETAHELVRKFQSTIFATSFVELFRGLLGAMSDKDKRCLQLGRELSSTVREFVTGAEANSFSPEMFVSFVTEAMEPLVSPCGGAELDVTVVQWLLEWIAHVYDLPNHELVLQLPRFLSHLYYLIARCPLQEAENIMERSLADTKRAFAQGLDINILDLLTTSVDCAIAIGIPATWKLALQWIRELLNLGHFKMLPLMHNITEAVLPQLGAKDLPIRILAQEANATLQHLVVHNESTIANQGSSVDVSGAAAPVGSSSHTVAIDDGSAAMFASSATAGPGGATIIAYYPVIQALMSHLDVKSKEETRTASLEWFLIIHTVRPDVIRDHFEAVFQSVLSTLADQSDNVMHKSVEVLCIIAGEDRFSYFIEQLLHSFEVKAPVMLPKAPTIIKQLQVRYQGSAESGFSTCEKLLLKIAELLPKREDLRLIEKLVIVLNTMLLTSKEFMPVRDVLRQGIGDDRARAAFLGLYRCWCFDVTAAVALCLLTTVYAHAYRLVVQLGSSEMSPQVLIQVDRLVQLLESPVFSFLRIALLKPTRNAALVKCFFGLQMILPQASQQYKTLSARLKAVPSVAQLELAVAEGKITGCGDFDAENEADERMAQLALSAISRASWREMEQFCVDVQKRVLQYETALRGAQRVTQ